MQICNQGELYTSRALTEKEMERIEKFLGTQNASQLLFDTDANTTYIEIEEYYNSSLDADIRNLIKEGIPISGGEITYWGDYDGKIYVRKNLDTGEVIVDVVDIQDVGLSEASDETLIRILTERGYKVEKIA